MRRPTFEEKIDNVVQKEQESLPIAKKTNYLDIFPALLDQIEGQEAKHIHKQEPSWNEKQMDITTHRN